MFSAKTANRPFFTVSEKINNSPYLLIPENLETSRFFLRLLRKSATVRFQ